MWWKRQHAQSLQLGMLFLAVLLPSGILAFLSIQGVLDEQALIREETGRRGGMIASGLAALIRDRFHAVEQASDSCAAELTKAGSLATNTGVSFLTVCIVDKSGRLLAPAPPWREAAVGTAGEDAALAALQDRMATAEQNEAEGRVEEASREFEKLLASASAPREKAVLINCLARTRKKTGRADEAATLYRRVIREFPGESGPGGISLALVAHLECIRAAVLKGDAPVALRDIRELLDQVRLGRMPCPRNQLLFAKQSLETWMAELRQRGSLSHSEAETFRRQFEAVETALSAQAAADLVREAGLLDRAGTGGYVYAALPTGIAGARRLLPGRDRAVGVRIDRKSFRAEFARDVRTAFAYADRFEYAISDAQGRVLLSSAPPAPGEPHARAAVGGDLPFSSVAVNIVQSEAVRDHVKRRRVLNLSVVGALVVMIATSLVLVLRIVRREQELSLMKDNFVAGVSHEMRLPLATIKMIGEMFSLGKVRGESQAGEYYHILEDETERLTRLVNRVLDFGRMESGRKPYERAIQPIAPIVEEAVARFRKYARSAVVSLDVSPDTGSASVDRESLQEVVFNLLENAVKYSPANPSVAVRTYARDGRAAIEVADTGIGMEPRVVERIFEPFYRAENELTRETQGAGIGLAIVKHIVDAHNGRIEVRSQKGKGSVFTVTLPAA